MLNEYSIIFEIKAGALKICYADTITHTSSMYVRTNVGVCVVVIY